MLDIEKYSETMDELIVKMHEIKSFRNPNETQHVFEKICRLLRIGRIETRFFQTLTHEESNNPIVVLTYNDVNVNENPEQILKFREMIENGSVVHYVFYPLCGEESWTPAEVKKIQTLQKLIFAYNGRSNLLLITNDLAYNDRDLQIPNLAFFMKKTGEYMARRSIGNYSAAFFNLRSFSIVNNQVGRDEGTVIMKKYIHILKNALSENELVCRVGGDNFVVLFLNEHLETVTVHLSGVRIKSDHFRAEFIISAYAGFYVINPEECKLPTDIMERIATTANIAKKSQGLPFLFYNYEIQENIRRIKMIENLMPDAIKNEEFLVYYQPKVDIKKYVLGGAEALCRWRHDGELIPPFHFIPILERSKLICQLDFYMLEHVCRDIRRWLDEGKPVVKISVNLSRVHLGDVNLLDDIINIIDKYRVPHKYIEIELTETTTDVDYNELKKIVGGLRDAGISTSVDDFGVGYSSLNLIRELPWNVLKIDKSFLPDGESNEKQSRTMLKYVIAMAHDLGLECIVEGVEYIEHVTLLKEFGCFLAQGFYFDKPLPVEVFENRLTYR